MPACDGRGPEAIREILGENMRSLLWGLACLPSIAAMGCDGSLEFSQPGGEVRIEDLEVSVLEPASRKGHFYCIRGEVLFVSDDANQGQPVVYSKELSSDEITLLARAVAAVPIDKLQSEYRQQGMLDGLWMEWRIPVPGRPSYVRAIHVENYYQPDLMRLASVIDSLIPEAYRLNYMTWEEYRKRHPETDASPKGVPERTGIPVRGGTGALPRRVHPHPALSLRGRGVRVTGGRALWPWRCSSCAWQCG